MENFFSRYRNISILTGLLFLQILGLAVQVRRVKENNSTLLIRVWTAGVITPLEKGIVGIENGLGNIWHNYIYLHGVRKENRQLKEEIQQLRLNEVRLNADAEQAHRLQLLLAFKERYISQTTAAQVIGSGGTDQSRVIYIDKGEDANLKVEMPVITADGAVGKISRVDSSTSQVFLINDQTTGVGTITEKSRTLGVVHGTPDGGLVLDKVMSNEQVQIGERVLTSGGDRIFPEGIPVGVVSEVMTAKDGSQTVRIKSAADMNKLEEVLVVTKQENKEPSLQEAGVERASDILARRLPSVPDQPPADATHKLIAVPGAAKPAMPVAGKDLAAKDKTNVNAAQAGAAAPHAVVPVSQPGATIPPTSNPVVRTITDESPAPPRKVVQPDPVNQSQPTQSQAPEDNQQ